MRELLVLGSLLLAFAAACQGPRKHAVSDINGDGPAPRAASPGGREGAPATTEPPSGGSGGGSGGAGGADAPMGTGGTTGQWDSGSDPAGGAGGSGPDASGAVMPVAPRALAAGEDCAVPAQCGSGVCADGVCCATACTGKCQACATEHTGLPDGTCGPVRAGGDPRNECEKSVENTCGDDGSCDGSGTCKKYGRETICAVESCTLNEYTPPRFCDGQEQCSPAAAPIPCGAFPCAAGRCRMICTLDQQCASGNYCQAGGCVAKNRTGVGCAEGRECLTGFCADGICCNSPCSGICRSCRSSATGSADGQCLPVENGADPDNECLEADPVSCGNDGYCNGRGACRKWAPDAICTVGHQRCGPGGGVQACVMSGRCATWGPETSCPTPDHACSARGNRASCECRSMEWRSEEIYVLPPSQTKHVRGTLSLAAGSNGDLHALFVQQPNDPNTDPYRQVMYGERRNARWFVSEVTSWYDETEQPQIGVDSSGTVHALFLQRRVDMPPTAKRIFHAIRRVNSWEISQVPPVGDQTFISTLDFVVRGSNLALVHDGIGMGPCAFEIRSRMRTGNGGWISIPIVPADNPTACAPAVALDATGKPNVTFFDLPTRSLRLSDGTTAQTVEKDLNQHADRGYLSRVDIDDAGGVHIVAGTAVGLGGPLRYSYRAPGQISWQQESVTDSAGPFDVVLDARGGLHVVFSEVGTLGYASRPPGGPLSTSLTSALPEVIYAPDVAVATTAGVVHVIWAGSFSGNLFHGYRCMNQ
jgi:hypothetical protein